MTSNDDLPPVSLNVTVVTCPLPPPSSLVHARQEWGVTSRYRPKNSMGFGPEGLLNTRRYLPPVRTSISHASKVRPYDFGAHHRLNSSGLVHASNTMRAGAL